MDDTMTERMAAIRARIEAAPRREHRIDLRPAGGAGDAPLLELYRHAPSDLAYLLDGLLAMQTQRDAARAEARRLDKSIISMAQDRAMMRDGLRKRRAEAAAAQTSANDRVQEVLVAARVEMDGLYQQIAALERRVEELRDALREFGDHDSACLLLRDLEPQRECSCGYSEAYDGTGYTPKPSPVSPLLALGRASLALERAERAWNAALDDAGLSLAEGTARRAARERASAAYAAALRVAMEGETK
jgi:hypothetical protein